jgi:acyl transferase domain-containing protein/3-hydroxymyristoyl/3-hydroxydecanoyl-(acyl carrier protein) dehydratase
MTSDKPIAVVGLSGLFPGALDVQTLWKNILARHDATTEVRRSRWIAAPESMVTSSLQPDRAYSRRCCLLPDFRFDPRGLKVDPALAVNLDPLYHVVLHAGRDLLTGDHAPRLNLSRTGIILAAIVLPTEAASTLTRELIGQVIENAVLGRSADVRPQSAFGRERYFATRVAALPASLLARAFDLGGGSYTLDAACASSLYAVKLACDELAAGRADAMVTGGVSRPDNLFTQIGFSQLRALSPSGRCAPFDRSADGLVVGEGAGLLVLKRLEDALTDGDRIYGLIRGIGLSNDLKGSLLSPDTEGQARAMRAAYAAAGWSPTDVDHIECHGAGTPVGDATELASLRALWGESGWRPGQCAIGSIKSMIGHLLTAAGAAGLIKTLLALHHGVLPPTLHFSQAPDGSPLVNGPFRVQIAPQSWPRRGADAPRRAAISAFGFGGINAHLLIEEWLTEGGWRKAEGGRAAPKPKAKAGGREGRTGAAGEGGRAEGGNHGPTGKRANGGRQLALAGFEFQNAPTLPKSDIPSGLNREKPAVAIVGMAVSVGVARSLDEFADAVRHKRSLLGPRPGDRWKGCDELIPGSEKLRGAFLDEILLDSAQFHIPPREIPDILPQHVIMLKTAADALADAGLPLRRERPSVGAVIGIDFDFEATQFHLRWHLESVFPQWVRTYFPHLSPQQADRWLSELKEACCPPLTPNRVLGALGSMIASRIAREFHFGGPSFVVSAEGASGLRAFEIGARALQSGELDAVLVGAVDLYGDLRNAALRPEARTPCPADGAVAVVLKRLEDAESEGCRIYAIMTGIGAAGGGGPDGREPSREAALRPISKALSQTGIAADSIGWFESHDPIGVHGNPLADPGADSEHPHTGPALEPVSSAALIGDCGAAAGLVSLVKAVLEMAHSRTSIRSALVAASTRDGNCLLVVLECPAGDGPCPMRLSESVSQRTPEKSPVRLPVAGKPLRVPAPPPPPPPVIQDVPDPGFAAGGLTESAAEVLENMVSVSEATAKAHSAYLDLYLEMTRAFSEALQLQSRMAVSSGDIAPLPSAGSGRTPPPAFDREQCLEFARGSAAAVMGPEFAEVDAFPARVRLPDEPLMLVDRILEVHGVKGSLGPGRILTEHDVLPAAWYLDGARAPVCISVEAGQADLFLCSYLGIDRVVRGRRTYRLLDATVRFHRELPRAGETIRYAIEIEKFIRQSETYLFLFHFEGTIDGLPLITMTDGCAGFFTPEEVAASGGIILTDEEKKPLTGKLPTGWTFPVTLSAEAYDEAGLEALRAGDPAACFGEMFSGIVIPESLRLPGGRMRLIDRVPSLEPKGGRFGLGRIRAEADIHPDDWFLTCHFVDDRVMPGTLMYECCAHTLRVLVQRMGWVIDRPEVRYEPVQGVAATLKCRGPVTPATKRVVYEIDVKELGGNPQPFVIADANIYADGHHIVRFSDMSMQLTGAAKSEVDVFWQERSARVTLETKPRVLFSRERLEEFATGRPSAAFGPPYAPFDSGRFIARLPAPPFLCMDRITAAEPPSWVVKPGGWVEAEFDLRPEAWYVAAERTGDVPYSILLEAALQPCGWLAAYMGSALKSENALHFRNLGGQATLHRRLPGDAGTLRIRTRLTHASEVTDMIIEHFDFEIHGPQGLIYGGSTYFGFFTPAALERQEGLRDIRSASVPTADDAPYGAPVFEFPAEPPLHPYDPQVATGSGLKYPAKALSMIDRIERYQPDGGPKGLGMVLGIKEVDPEEWFFKAHFYQDPVVPGSLGIESFLQLVKFAAQRRWPHLAGTHRFGLHTGHSHRWTYRGQVLPANRRVTVEAAVTEVIESPFPALIAEGLLMVDGLPIYRMEEFGIELVPYKL